EADAQVSGTPETGDKKLPKSQDKLDEANTKSTEKTDGTSSSGAGVAASIAFNWITSDNTASIADGLHVISGGATSVIAESEVDITTKAIGAALSFDSKAGVGAAVAMNVGDVSNKALIGSTARIAADGISVKAQTPVDRSNDFTVWGLAIGGGKDYGVAGSVGINAVSMTTEASVGTGAHLTSQGDIDVMATNAIAYQNIAGGGGVGKTAGVGVAVAVNIITQDTDAFIGSDVQADAKETITVKADSSIAPLKLSVSGSATPEPEISSVAAGGGVSSDSGGKVAVGGSAIVDVIIQNTHAYIADGSKINVTSGFIPGVNQSVAIEATSATRIVNGAGGLAISCGNTGVGVGLDVGIIEKETTAYIGSSTIVKADDDVSITATSTEDILSLAASAGVSKENGIGGALTVFVLTSATR
ncbi:MAG: hypothetical protein GY934_11355, partial [Gammaproteobacteria bacterium]|nr:hypothetical protein [Gammaproteobacteria bacterium]